MSNARLSDATSVLDALAAGTQPDRARRGTLDLDEAGRHRARQSAEGVAKSSAGVSEWKMIQSLDLNNTQVSDLAPLAGLTRARVCALKAGDLELVWSKNSNGGRTCRS